jgi:hypothetical protein
MRKDLLIGFIAIGAFVIGIIVYLVIRHEAYEKDRLRCYKKKVPCRGKDARALYHGVHRTAEGEVD